MPTHKIIVLRSKRANGQQTVQYLGSGCTEDVARQAAFTNLHHGHNPCDDAYAGGECFTASQRLSALLADDAGDDDGIQLNWAISSLYLRRDNTICARYVSREEWDRAQRPSLRQRFAIKLRKAMHVRRA